MQLQEEKMSDEYLIKNTTREQREEIVKAACGNDCGACDGCAGGLGYDLYKPYIEGRMEIAEINATFRAQYMHSDDGAEVSASCGEVK